LIGVGLLSLVDNLVRNRRRAVATTAGSTSLRFEYRSGFWPIILLGVGTIWLLGNQGYIPEFYIFGMVSLWPLLLIGAGIDILFGRHSFWIGALIGLAMLAIAAGLLVTRPDMLPKWKLSAVVMLLCGDRRQMRASWTSIVLSQL